MLFIDEFNSTALFTMSKSTSLRSSPLWRKFEWQQMHEEIVKQNRIIWLFVDFKKTVKRDLQSASRVL